MRDGSSGLSLHNLDNLAGCERLICKRSFIAHSRLWGSSRSLADQSHIPRVGYFYFDFSIFDLILTNFGQYFINITAKFANSAEKTISSN